MILILGGTTEAMLKAEELDRKGIVFILSVATDYGYQSFSEYFGNKVLKINFTEEKMRAFIQEHGIKAVYDCTHPYATMITETAMKVCHQNHIDYVSFIRRVEKELLDYENTFYIQNMNEIPVFIREKKVKRILFTIGSKKLEILKKLKGVELYVRVLPDIHSIEKCMEVGVKQKNIIAMQGPFTVALNAAMIKQFDIDCLVTKNSGRVGGFIEKLKACHQSGIYALVIDKI